MKVSELVTKLLMHNSNLEVWVRAEGEFECYTHMDKAEKARIETIYKEKQEILVISSRERG